MESSLALFFGLLAGLLIGWHFGRDYQAWYSDKLLKDIVEKSNRQRDRAYAEYRQIQESGVMKKS